MRAARIHAFGEHLRMDDVPEPLPGEGDVLIEVHFAGVNPLDVWATQGTVAGGAQTLPFVPGSEGVGVVDGRLHLVHGGGLGVRRDGLYRERANVPRSALIPLPEGVDPRQAAGCSVTGATAWALVHDVARVTSQDRVLVLGASGGVGSLVVQVARAVGATVWGQTSSGDKAAFIEEIGADGVVVATADELERAAAPLEATVVVDPLGDGFTLAALAALQPFGRLAVFGTSAGSSIQMDLRSLYRKSIQLLTYSGTIEREDRVRAAKERTLEAMARGELRVWIDEVLPLERAAEAHRRILDRRVRGKLLLTP